MKKSKFTELQIVSILKEGKSGVGIAELTRKHGISRASDEWLGAGAAMGMPTFGRVGGYSDGVGHSRNGKLPVVVFTCNVATIAVFTVGLPPGRPATCEWPACG